MPQYIDESANQEAPTSQASEWVASGSSLMPANGDVTKAILDYNSNSSSGYYSSTSHSAPPSCPADSVCLSHP